MGASGIISSIITTPFRTWQTQSWKIIFAASFVGAANLYIHFLDPNTLNEDESGRQLSILGYLVTGFLIGFGTRLGNGCTSGHGICGLPRFSRRSVAAVCTFMGVGMATATLFSNETVRSWFMFLFADSPQLSISYAVVALVFGVMPVGLALLAIVINRPRKTLGAVVSGALFAVGLAVSKMVLPSKVLGFLDLSGIPAGSYDPSLVLVMAGGLLISWLGYQFRHRHCDAKPLLADEYSIPCKTAIDMPLLLGSSIFGLGWGCGGLCPGPALFWAAVGSPSVAFLWMPAFFVGSLCWIQSSRLLDAPVHR